MKIQEMIPLPKSDDRYKAGKIVKDKKGVFRGNSETVSLKTINLPIHAPEYLILNPPLLASPELSKHLRKYI